jgi:hypothetical protein
MYLCIIDWSIINGVKAVRQGSRDKPRELGPVPRSTTGVVREQHQPPHEVSDLANEVLSVGGRDR